MSVLKNNMMTFWKEGFPGFCNGESDSSLQLCVTGLRLTLGDRIEMTLPAEPDSTPFTGTRQGPCCKRPRFFLDTTAFLFICQPSHHGNFFFPSHGSESDLNCFMRSPGHAETQPKPLL